MTILRAGTLDPERRKLQIEFIEELSDIDRESSLKKIIELSNLINEHIRLINKGIGSGFSSRTEKKRAIERIKEIRKVLKGDQTDTGNPWRF